MQQHVLSSVQSRSRPLSLLPMEPWCVFPDTKLSFQRKGEQVLEIFAHRGVLSAACPFFDRFFSQYALMRKRTAYLPHPTDEPQSYCHVYDPIGVDTVQHFTAKAFTCFLSYVYQRTLPSNAVFCADETLFMGIGELAAFCMCTPLIDALIERCRSAVPPIVVICGMFHLWKHYAEFLPLAYILANLLDAHLPVDFFLSEQHELGLEKRPIAKIVYDAATISAATWKNIEHYFSNRPCIPESARGQGAYYLLVDIVHFYVFFVMGLKSTDIFEHTRKRFSTKNGKWHVLRHARLGKLAHGLIDFTMDKDIAKLTQNEKPDDKRTTLPTDGPWVRARLPLFCKTRAAYPRKDVLFRYQGCQTSFRCTSFYDDGSSFCNRLRIELRIPRHPHHLYLPVTRETGEAFRVFIHPFCYEDGEDDDFYPIHIPASLVDVGVRSKPTIDTHAMAETMILTYDARLPAKPATWSESEWQTCFQCEDTAACVLINTYKFPLSAIVRTNLQCRIAAPAAT